MRRVFRASAGLLDLLNNFSHGNHQGDNCKEKSKCGVNRNQYCWLFFHREVGGCASIATSRYDQKEQP